MPGKLARNGEKITKIARKRTRVGIEDWVQ
jgi:hypothetical protein